MPTLFFLPRLGTWLEAGKLPWRTMVRYSGMFGKNRKTPRAGNKVGCPLFFLHPPVAMPPAYFPISPKELNGVALILWRSVEVRLGKFVQ